MSWCARRKDELKAAPLYDQKMVRRDAVVSARRRRQTILDEFEPFHWRFSTVQRQHAVYEIRFEDLLADQVIFHFDYKQNISVFQGPAEGEVLVVRQDLIVFGVLVDYSKGDKVERRYVIYFAEVLDKPTSLIEIFFNGLLLPHLPKDLKKVHFWADCGQHIRSHQFMSGLANSLFRFGRAAILDCRKALFASHKARFGTPRKGPG